MPSGAKKRKAARRKKEMGQGAHSPHSPTSPPAPPSPSGGGDGHGHHREEDSASSGEEDAADRETAVVKREEAAAPVSKEVQEVSVEVAPVPASEESQEVGVDLVRDGAPEAGVVADFPAVVPVDGSSSAKEEVVEVAEPAAETSKTSIDVDSLSHGTEQKPVTVLNNLVSQVPRENTELCRGTADSEVSVTLLERRATWWNCCGLFDVLTGSRENSRCFFKNHRLLSIYNQSQRNTYNLKCTSWT
ncbi:uncharacterized protein LOC135630706 isoform X1 [Musa acuminata AAA Group]|uniref:uncharacterized protein LOC135630706 isoform X1 n=2 Tax=Musa acuminata AAA Group TaxID=214697 RepID=UPI0031E1E1F6